MGQPESCVEKGKENMVYKLRRGIYGLKQESENSYKGFEYFMCDNKFIKTTFDNCVNMQRYSTGNFIILFTLCR